jgi:hypothetical protein
VLKPGHGHYRSSHSRDRLPTPNGYLESQQGINDKRKKAVAPTVGPSKGGFTASHFGFSASHWVGF